MIDRRAGLHTPPCAVICGQTGRQLPDCETQLLVLALVFLVTLLSGCRRDRKSLVLAVAASAAPPVERLAAIFEREHEQKVRISAAASSTLARQIETGAPVSLFISAHPRWLERLERSDRLVAGTRVELMRTRLVLAAPRTSKWSVKMKRGAPLAEAFEGRLAVGDPSHVPLGIYARAALRWMRWWKPLRQRLAPAVDARAALALVERSACQAGVLYEVDAHRSRAVRVVGRFPPQSHPPVRYQMALIRGDNGDARRLWRFLRSERARGVLTEHGFSLP